MLVHILVGESNDSTSALYMSCLVWMQITNLLVIGNQALFCTQSIKNSLKI